MLLLGVLLVDPEDAPVPPGTGEPLLGTVSPGALAAEAPGMDALLDDDPLSLPVPDVPPELRPPLPVPAPMVAEPGAPVPAPVPLPAPEPAPVPLPDGTSFWVPGVDPTGGGLLPPMRSHAASDKTAAAARETSSVLLRGRGDVVGETMVSS